MFPCGCNESEAQVYNWYDVDTYYMRISFPDDSTILFTSTLLQNNIFLKGKLKGPNVSDIYWEIKEGDAFAWKPVWVKVFGSGQCNNCVGHLDSLIYSVELMATIKGRPINESEYSLYARYHYILLHK